MLSSTTRAAATHAMLAWALLATSTAQAGSHLWRISEVFSTADGTIQFVELTETGGSDDEWHLQGKRIRSDTNFFVFPYHLPPMTAYRKFLIGTQSFADLATVPTPDYVISDNFFATDADSVILHTYDMIEYASGMLPTDGLHSLDRLTGEATVNSPTNFAGETATIDLSVDSDDDTIADLLDNCTLVANADQRDTDTDDIGNLCDPDMAPQPNDCAVNFADLAAMKSAFLANPGSGNWNPDADLDGDANINFGDVALLKSYFLGTPGPSGKTNACD